MWESNSLSGFSIVGSGDLKLRVLFFDAFDRWGLSRCWWDFLDKIAHFKRSISHSNFLLSSVTLQKHPTPTQKISKSLKNLFSKNQGRAFLIGAPFLWSWGSLFRDWNCSFFRGRVNPFKDQGVNFLGLPK